MHVYLLSPRMSLQEAIRRKRHHQVIFERVQLFQLFLGFMSILWGHGERKYQYFCRRSQSIHAVEYIV